MERNIILYPTLGAEMLDKLEFKVADISASYSDGNEKKELRCAVEGTRYYKTIMIIDDAGNWSPDNYNLEISGNIEIGNPEVLFGEDSIAGIKDVIGIGMIFKSRTSSTRSADCLGSIGINSGKTRLPFKKAYSASSLRGNLDVTFTLFMKEKESMDSVIPLGATIGELSEYVFILEGMGSTFSVFEKNAPGEPLWSVECDWDEPEYSMFSDSVKVTINTAHRAWMLLTEDDMRKELLKEIMASSMQIVISSLEPEQYSIQAEYEPGSVSNAVAYLVDKASIDNESPASVATSLRKYLDKNMK